MYPQTGELKMESRLTGFRVVAGLSNIYAMVMGGFVVLIFSNPKSAPRDEYDWLMAVTFVLTPLPLLIGGVLVFSKNLTAVRAGSWLLGIAGLLLLAKAFVVSLAVIHELRHPSSSTGALIIFLVPMIVMPASIWGIVVL